MIVREEAFAALGDPFDRPAELARGVKRQRVLGRGHAFRAESAADIAGDDAEAVLGNLEDVLGEGAARAVDRADAAIEREAAEALVVFGDDAARLDRVVHDARDDEMLARDVMRLGESGIDRGLVADLEKVRDVVGAIRPDRRRAGLHRIAGQHDRGQRLVIDLDALRRVFRFGEAFGDDIGDLVADEMRLRRVRGRDAGW